MTDRHGHPRALRDTVRAVLAGGARWVWFRERDLPADERHRLGRDILGLVRAAGGIFSVGGDADLAALLGADGVHFGGDAPPGAIEAARRALGSGAWIGVSAHSLADVSAMAEAGADYVTLSPIFATSSKPGYGPALGTSALREAARSGLPVIALGGIEPATAGACRAAGAAGVAIMGGLMRAADPAEATRLYRAALQDPPMDGSRMAESRPT